jgi:hypothetical protein
MFRATMCPSTGETAVSMRHLVLVILYGWLSGMQVEWNYQVSHKHSCFSCLWAHSRPKHVEIDKYTKNKYTKNKVCTSWLYLQDCTGMQHSTNIVPVLYLLMVVGGCRVLCVVVSRWRLRIRTWRAVNVPLSVYEYEQFLQLEVLGC